MWHSVFVTALVVLVTLAPSRSAQAVDTGYLLAPKAFRAAADKVRPSLVTIETFGGIAKAGGKAAKKGRTPVRGISKPGEGPTTGLILSADGHIVTSTYNFITKPPIITVVLHDGSRHVAKLLGQDETRGLAILKIDTSASEGGDAPTLQPVKFAPPRDVVVGQWVVSVGVGYGGDRPAISAGIISAKNRIFGKAIQTDANTSPANYGGPLIDLDGRVIGVIAPLSPRSTGAGAGVEWYDSGIGFAVPLHGQSSLIERLVKGEVIKPGRMGVQPKRQTKPLPFGGVEIGKVMPNSPASKAGLKAGDIIYDVNGIRIEGTTDLRNVLGRYIAGDTVRVAVQRGGKLIEVDLTLSPGSDRPARPTPRPKPKVTPKKPEPKKE